LLLRAVGSSLPKRSRIEIVSSASVSAGGDETPANSSLDSVGARWASPTSRCQVQPGSP
jgi:hypothetical protein